VDDRSLAGCTPEIAGAHPELFHYTGLAAFESIIGTGTLWASHYRDLSDKEEVYSFRRLLPAAIFPGFQKELLALNRHLRRGIEKANGGALGLAGKFVHSLYGASFDGAASYGALDAFLVSFSTHSADDYYVRSHGIASQWESYAGPDGVCIVFDTLGMGELLASEGLQRYWLGPWLAPVRYADAPIQELFPELIDVAYRDFASMLSPNPRGLHVTDFLQAASLLKGAEFRSEREIRIFGISGSQALSEELARQHPDQFKPQPLPVIHSRPDSRRYVKLFDGLGQPLPIRRVIVGPFSDQGAVYARVRELLPKVDIELA
jgi:hypothetical protein